MSVYRVIALTAPAPHFVHRMVVVKRKGGATYEQCSSCSTRRIVIGPKARGYDAAWLRTGEFADEARQSATLFTLDTVKRRRIEAELLNEQREWCSVGGGFYG